MPTGVAIRDVRQQLFDAAERVLLKEGPNGLTSRAVTTEAGCAKGVLHKHFADFDEFLAELVLDRIARIGGQAEELRGSAGSGTVAGNLTAALMDLFSSVAASIVVLIIYRDELRKRLRAVRGNHGIPLLTEAGEMISSYLAAERDLGRITRDADIGTLTPTLLGGGHLLAADRDTGGPDADALHKIVVAALANVLR